MEVGNGGWKCCSVCSRICLDCKERFTWDQYHTNDVSLSAQIPEICEECTFVKQGICAGCFQNPIQEGRYCETCNKLKLTVNYLAE